MVIITKCYLRAKSNCVFFNLQNPIALINGFRFKHICFMNLVEYYLGVCKLDYPEQSLKEKTG